MDIGRMSIHGKRFPLPYGANLSSEGLAFASNDTAFEFCLEVIAAMADRKLQREDEHDMATDPLRNLVMRAFTLS